MKYIQSLFIRDDQNPFENSFGWAAPHYHLMGWALSCLTLKKQLGHLSLYCNKRAKELLIDILGLPYDEIHESMNGWEPPHPQLWALSKIHTYALQKSPFLHIDGDVFLFGKFPERITTGSVVAQNVEEFTDYYYSFMKPINRQFTYQPECLVEDFRKMENLHALNAGILGGCDIDFFQKYCAEAFKYVEANLPNLSKMDANRFNVFFEQHLCYKMAEEYNVKVEYLLPQTYHDNSYLGLDKFHEIESGNVKYLHLLGNYKADEFTCQQMAKTLLYLYPEYYFRITKICADHKNMQFSKVEPFEVKTIISRKNINLLQISQSIMLKHFQIMKEFENDYYAYINQISNHLCEFSNIPNSVLLNRDCHSFHWYHQIVYQNYRFERTPFVKVLTSNVDWARLYRMTVSSGIKYYSKYTIEEIKGIFYSVLIPEINDNGYSLFDIDSLESEILKFCYTPIKISNLRSFFFNKFNISGDKIMVMKFDRLLKENLKHLILIKALHPVED